MTVRARAPCIVAADTSSHAFPAARGLPNSPRLSERPRSRSLQPSPIAMAQTMLLLPVPLGPTTMFSREPGLMVTSLSIPVDGVCQFPVSVSSG